ncbi:MAG: PAS domain-containing protein [Actinomycetota bacterium]
MAETAHLEDGVSLRRDAILEAIAFAAERLLLSRDWRDVIDEVLVRLGEAAEVSRAYLIRNAVDALGRDCAVQLAEWCAPGIRSQFGNPILERAPWADFGFARWPLAMRSGDAIAGAVADLPDVERPALMEQDIVSLVCMPVQADDSWWGVIGFDDCAEVRDWTGAELEALRAAATVLGAAVTRQGLDERARATEARYRAFVEHIPAVTYTDIVEGGSARLEFLSPQIERILGYPRRRFFDDPDFWFSLVHPDDLERVIAAADAPTRFEEEYRMLAADGRNVWVHDISEPIEDRWGRTIYWLGFLTDVTERHEAESGLRVAEERFRQLVEKTPAVVYQEPPSEDAYDVASSFTYISPQVETILGYPVERWTEQGDFWLEVLHPDDREAVLTESERTALSGEPYRQDYRVIAADGRTVWFHDEAVLIRDADGEPALWQGVMLDITRRIDAEERLREAERRYRALVEHIPAVVYVESPDADPERFYLSPQVQRVFGWSVDEWTWTPDFWIDHVHPQDRDRVWEADQRSNRSKEPYAIEYRFLTKASGWVWVHDEVTFLETADGGCWQGFLLDITERKRAEEQLREAELKFRTIVEQNQAIFYMQEIDPDDPRVSNTVYVAPGNTDLIGYTAEEIEADPALWRKILHPEDRDRVVTADAESNLRGDGRFSLEYRMIRKDGDIVWVQDEATLVRPEGRQPYWQGFLLDITERKRAEARLAQALEVEREATNRLRALDEMKNTFLQAVSHDLRTPLSAILGLAVTLERPDVRLGDGDARDLAHRIAENARRLERLVRNLLDMDRLARGIVTPKLEPTDVAALIRRVLEESQAIEPGRLTVDLRPVEAAIDAAKVERIVENLLANTARHTPAETHVWLSVRGGGGGVTIAVEDEGPGVPAELRERIFEPFQQGSDGRDISPGVGVGLTLVRRFAELHGGRAWVEERAGGGASFRVFLPSGAEPSQG